MIVLLHETCLREAAPLSMAGSLLSHHWSVLVTRLAYWGTHSVNIHPADGVNSGEKGFLGTWFLVTSLYFYISVCFYQFPF
jgi:hypothetical protein